MLVSLVGRALSKNTMDPVLKDAAASNAIRERSSRGIHGHANVLR